MEALKRNNSQNINDRSDMSETVVAGNHENKPEMVYAENATREEKSSSRALAFSIDKIMSDETKPGSSTTSRGTDHRVWKALDGRTQLGADNDAAPEAKVVADQRHRSKPEVVSRNDAVTRYHLQQQKMKIANAVMLHMATGNGMASEVGGLFSAARHPELLLRQYHRLPYHLQAERYHQNAAGITSLPDDPVTSSFNRCRLPVSADVTWSPSSRSSEHRSLDKSDFTSESLPSPTRSAIWRKRTFYDARDVTDWSQMATGSLQRHRPTPTGSPQSVISDCSAARDEEEIIVDDDVGDRKQFSPTSELPVERPEVVNVSGDRSWTGKTGDVDMERSPGTSTW